MSDPRCEVHRERVSAFVDERLAGPELLLLEEHLESCAGCRAFEAGLRRYRELIRAAEAFRPLRTPPPGFAAAVVARVAAAPAATVPFPAARARRRPALWAGYAAAAAAAALFFAWSWQRLLPGEDPAARLARRAAPPVVAVAAVDEGNMDAWLREHAALARSGTLLGPAEEVEFASFSAARDAER